MAEVPIIGHGMNSMSDDVFIDTNILLYAYDRDAGAKHEIARAVVRQCWEQGTGVISIQVLCEFFVRSTRQADLVISSEEAESIVRNLSCSWRIIAPDTEIVIEAIKAHRDYRLSFWDALIWAASKKARVHRIYTEDFQHGQIIEGIKFLNPFLMGNGIDISK